MTEERLLEIIDAVFNHLAAPYEHNPAALMAVHLLHGAARKAAPEILKKLSPPFPFDAGDAPAGEDP